LRGVQVARPAGLLCGRVSWVDSRLPNVERGRSDEGEEADCCPAHASVAGCGRCQPRPLVQSGGQAERL